MAAEKTLEQLDKLGASSISLLNDFATKGVDFVVEQAPEVCSQIINRAMYQNIYLMVFWTLISCIFGFLIFLTIKKIKLIEKQKDSYEKLCKLETANVFQAIFSIATILSFFIGNGICGYRLVTILSSPKVYLIEYFSKLLK